VAYFSILHDVFKSQFYPSICDPEIDTCNRCDALNTKLKPLQENDKKKKGFNSTEIAPPKRNCSKKRKDEDTTEAKYDETKKVLILDLQKTLPTLSLSTSVTCYKHQMWTFNLGILDAVTVTGYMNVWSENLAS
jgi:hypothetical protein